MKSFGVGVGWVWKFNLRLSSLLLMPESPKERRDRIEREAAEALNKRILASLSDVLDAATSGDLGDKGSPTTITQYRHAAFLGVLSNDAYNQAREAAQLTEEGLKIQETLLEHTKKVSNLTWALVWLTAGLLLFTIYLAYDTHLKGQRDKEAEDHQSEPSHSQSEIHTVTVPY